MSEDDDVLSESIIELSKAKVDVRKKVTNSARYLARVRVLSITSLLFRRRTVKARLPTSDGGMTILLPVTELDGQYAQFRVVSMGAGHVVCSIPDKGKQMMVCFPRSSVNLIEA